MSASRLVQDISKKVEARVVPNADQIKEEIDKVKITKKAFFFAAEVWDYLDLFRRMGSVIAAIPLAQGVVTNLGENANVIAKELVKTPIRRNVLLFATICAASVPIVPFEKYSKAQYRSARLYNILHRDAEQLKRNLDDGKLLLEDWNKYQQKKNEIEWCNRTSNNSFFHWWVIKRQQMNKKTR